ncbi:MAG: PEP-CTERM sorting domain-containing protein, partial [Phycisphaerae bacterium]|nr:PEP-CTERM sorting domain-containing protein [Phycisphaerae bacterium]MDW8261565.1 PEP-CTERM sorting domain-containing protein [Phycisphaerales bacterium]
FFNSDETLMTPGSDYGSNPLSVGFDGTNAYVGGYHSDTGTLASFKAGIVQVAGVTGLSPVVNPIAGSVFTITQNARGIDAIACFGGDIYFLHDNSVLTDFVRRMTPAGTTVWQTSPPASQRIGHIAIDPRGGAGGTPALGLVARGSGRLQSLELATGTPFFTQSGGANPGPLITTTPSLQFAMRGLSFSADGDIAYTTDRGVAYGDRAGNASFTNLSGGAGATASLQKTPFLDNVGNAVAILENAGAGGLKLLATAQRVGGSATLGFNGTFTSSTGVVSGFDARWVHLRNLDGNVTGLTQTQLFGDEDGIGTQYSGEVKNFASALDANGNPILLVLSFADKRLDVYQLEPTWNSSGGGNWESAGNWFNATVPNSALLNAKFGSAISANSTVNVVGPKTTKNLKFDNAAASYTLNGATITLAAPAGVRGQITNIAGSHTVKNAIALQADSDLRVNGAADTLTLDGGISGPSHALAKLGAGTATVRNVRVDTLDVRAGTVRVLPTGGSDGVSVVGSNFLIANDGMGNYSASFDVSSNALIYRGTQQATVVNALVAGRAGGTWTGAGFRSSAAAANPSTHAVGYATAAEVNLTSYLGIPLLPSDSLFRYTRLGDSNLNGTTELGDFALLAANFNQPGRWFTGDYNLDGSADLSDFALLASNFNQSVAQLPRSAVPEPATLGSVAVAAVMLLVRRRR